MERKPPVIVALLGRKGSGKTTAAQFVRVVHGAKVFSFATKVKQLAGIVWGFSEEQLYGTQEEKEKVDADIGISGRDGAQRLGQGARQVIDDNIWVDACLSQIREQCKIDRDSPNRPLYIIDDARFTSECTAIRKYDDVKGIVVKVVCPSSDRSDHPTEKAVDEVPSYCIDYTVVNDGDVEAFQSEISRIIAEVIKI